MSRLQLSTVGLLLGAGAAAAVLAGCPQRPGSPIKSLPPARYQQMVSAFYAGTVALQVGDTQHALPYLQHATRLVPEEPAAWANLSVLQLRTQDYAGAQKSLKKAQEEAGPDSDLEYLAGVLADRQNAAADAVQHYRKSIELDPDNIRAHYALADALSRESGTGASADQEVIQHLEKILEVQPGNIVAQLDLLRLAAKTGSAELYRKLLKGFEQLGEALPAEARPFLKQLEQAPDTNLAAATTPAIMFRNTMKQLPQFVQQGAELGIASTAAGAPLERFLRLPAPSPAPAAPDTGMTLTAEPVGSARAVWAAALPLQGAAPPEMSEAAREDPEPVVVAAEGSTLLIGSSGARLAFPGKPAPEGALFADLDNDYRMDAVLAGSGGVRMFQQGKDGRFTDVTARSGLPAAVLRGSYSGAWALDYDSDGDLDVILGPARGEPKVLRNNGNGAFTAMPLFQGVSGIRRLVWGDFDGDGDADVALTDAAGELHVFENRRGGYFTAIAPPADLGRVLALSVADVDADGTVDLVVLVNGASIRKLTLKDAGKAEWEPKEIAAWQDAPPDDSARLLWADLDNNGAPDLVASGSLGARVWLMDGSRALTALSPLSDAQVFAAADLTGDGRLDLVGVNRSRAPVRLVNKGTKSYNWQALRPRSDPKVRDNSGNSKLNSFGIGGEAEMRAGLLFVKQPVTGPVLHFGLGDNPKADFARVVWPNGQPQAEFDLASNQPALVKQRLTGSCPWLFAWNGKQIDFVTDILWKSPLGLRINAQDTAGVSQTRDWVKIRGDQLQPRDGGCDLRITAELWETDFFDHVSLMTVDHPRGTEVFVDERFSIPQPPLTLHATGPVHPVARAVDDLGADVTGVVKARDGQYLDTFGPGKYQGLTRDHYVEVELPPDAPAKHLLLVGQGWIFPTDSSINVAIAQEAAARPTGLSIEVPDGKGGWRTARAGLGFPAGKNKTVLLNLDGLFPDSAERRLRLRTNLEVYWDFLGWAEERPAAELKTAAVLPSAAELRYRGFSSLSQAKRSSPELPDYNRIAQSGQVWLDLVGHYTRFGDVRELLEKVDDRYVIMNAGDEIALRFPAAPPPPQGWVRDFVFVSDGWDKDGNFNTAFSKTVLPLPSHDRPDYDTPPVPLTQDPVYRKHPEDWVRYHTRYVDVTPFRRAMVPNLAGRREH